MQKHDNYNGIFLTKDREFTGILRISGGESVLKLIGKAFWKKPDGEYIDIHGILIDGQKASLLNCIPTGNSRYRFDENSQFESSYFPNYVVVGEEYIRSSEPVIRSIRYHFGNINHLLTGYKTFQSLHPSPNEVRQILETNHKKNEKIAEDFGWEKQAFEPEISENPHLLYFSGLWEIISFGFDLGTISLKNRTTHNLGSSKGIGISNEVTVDIDFTEPKTLESALFSLRKLHGLLELSLGHRQRYDWIELDLIYESKKTTQELPQRARLYWSLCNSRVKDDSIIEHHDVLFSIDQQPEEFSKIAEGWMNSHESMGDPRDRFATAFFSSYDINRIVGAANMFDLLPDSHVPKKKEVDSQLKEAISQCRSIFKNLPESFARQSVLDAMGRIGKASLREKIYHQADKVMVATGNIFPNLYLPCQHAVVARNHYVHGSPRSFNYQLHFTEFAFIIDTLEFVFAAADLIDLGWDVKRWIEKGSTMHHSFDAYRLNYSFNIHRLQELVKK